MNNLLVIPKLKGSVWSENDDCSNIVGMGAALVGIVAYEGRSNGLVPAYWPYISKGEFWWGRHCVKEDMVCSITFVTAELIMHQLELYVCSERQYALHSEHSVIAETSRNKDDYLLFPGEISTCSSKIFTNEKSPSQKQGEIFWPAAAYDNDRYGWTIARMKGDTEYLAGQEDVKVVEGNKLRSYIRQYRKDVLGYIASLIAANRKLVK